MIKYIATTKEYFDDINGNSYFSSRIEDIENDRIYILPFQYGYGDQSQHEIKKVIKCFNKNVQWSDIRYREKQDCTRQEAENHGQGIEENYISNPGYYYQD
jgi:hypothetical protein